MLYVVSDLFKKCDDENPQHIKIYVKPHYSLQNEAKISLHLQILHDFLSTYQNHPFSPTSARL